MKAILVTGGAGFIGSQFVRQTIAANRVNVVVLDALTYAGSRENLATVADSPRLHFFQGSITDRHLVARLLREYHCSAVLNFAAETHVDRSIGRPGDFVRTNVLGVFELLEASLGHYESLDEGERQSFRFLHVSTDEVYGQLGPSGRFTESTPYAPSSPYSASKASSDHFVRAYHHTYGLPTLITNCSNNYGPYQFPEKLVPLMIRKAINGETLPVYGNGENVRDWLHVEDHCRALQDILDRGRVGETYNIGGGCELTNIEVVTRICAHVDQLSPHRKHPSSSQIRYVADRPGHDFRYAVDFSKLRDEIGWTPQISFDAGIARTVRWYLNHTAWIMSVMQSGGYGLERLGFRPRSSSASPDLGDRHSEDDVYQEIEGVSITPRTLYRDARGWLVEVFRTDEIDEALLPKMSYITETVPGVTRGPFERREQTDHLAFIGPSDFRLYLWDARPGSPTEGNRVVRLVGESNPAAVTIPPGVVHAYKNVGAKAGQVINSPSELIGGTGRRSAVEELHHGLDDSPYIVS